MVTVDAEIASEWFREETTRPPPQRNFRRRGAFSSV